MKKKTYTIDVTKKHIDVSQIGMYCPIDHAAWPVFGSRLGNVHTHHTTMNIIDDDGMIYKQIKLPEIAKKFIKDFDNNKPVKPFSFEVVA